MNKKKTRKSRAAKSVRNLPVKALNAKTVKGVRGGGKKGGSEGPTESISLSFGKPEIAYNP